VVHLISVHLVMYILLSSSDYFALVDPERTVINYITIQRANTDGHCKKCEGTALATDGLDTMYIPIAQQIQRRK